MTGDNTLFFLQPTESLNLKFEINFPMFIFIFTISNNDNMSLEVYTRGSCVNEVGQWSYLIEYYSGKTQGEFVYSDSGEEKGTTDIQMKLMAILQALTYLHSINSTESIIVKTDCSLCIKCITKEYDCTSGDVFKREKVTRGFNQYLQEIWWKMGSLDVFFTVSNSTSTLLG